MDMYYIEFRAMGCKVEVQLETECDGYTLLNTLPSQLEAYEAILSRFREDSDLSHLNRNTGRWVTVNDTLFQVVQQAKHGARRTDGLYNPLILKQMMANGYAHSFEKVDRPISQAPQPAQNWQSIGINLETQEVYLPVDCAIDLGGIAKGWVSAEIARQLGQHGACLVNIGGDITMTNAPSGQAGWEIEVDDPFTGNVLTSFCLTNTTIITSGIDYRQWTTSDGVNKHHIIDPRTGYPADTDILTVTIIHPHAPSAEVFAKAVLLMNSQAGLEWLHQQWRTKALIVRQDGCVMATTNFNSLVKS